jgi:AraC-like DNA-binding protein
MFLTARAVSPSQAMRETTIAATVVVDMLQYLEREGVPAEEARRECGLVIDVPPRADQRVPGGQVERLWDFAQQRTGDSLVGLHMAERYNPSTLDILGYVVLSCHTIGEVLDRLSRYVRLLNDGLRVDISRDSRNVYCRCRFIEGMNNYLLRDAHHAVDTVWVGLARELKRLTATPLFAREVAFRRKTPSPVERAEYERIFECKLVFGATEDRFVLPSEHLDVRVLSAHPAMLQSFERHADSLLATLDTQGAKSREVARVLTERLKGAVPELSEVARELAMSDRNLQRALRNDGTSFKQLLDDVRRDLAIRHLSDPSASAGQVGFLLGFSEPSAFHRAFRRWTGKAPGEYRSGALI